MPTFQSVTVLILDPSPMTRFLLRSELTLTGKNIYQAETPEEALGILKSIPIQLVLSSIQLKEIDGFEFAKLIQYRYKHKDDFASKDVAFAFVSSDSKNVIESHSSFSGSEDFHYPLLSKYFQKGELKSQLKAYLDKITETHLEPVFTMRDKTCLVVEDSETNRKILTRNLTKRDWKYWEVENGKQAMDFLLKNPFAVEIILTDQYMDEMNGNVLCQKLKSKLLFRTIPIFLLTGETEDEHIQSYKRDGADFILTKPYNIEELFHLMDSCVGNF